MARPATEDLLPFEEVILHSHTDVEHSAGHLLGGFFIAGPVIGQMAMVAPHT